MPVLTIGTRSFTVSPMRVDREATRMFRRMSPERRAHRVEIAKTQLSRAAGSEDTERGGALKRAAAVLLAQGITEI